MIFRMLMPFALIVSSLLAACGTQLATPAADAAAGVPVEVEGRTYTNVTPAQLAGMLKSKDFLFVNTHIPYEGEIAQTDALIAFNATGSQRVNDYPTDKSAKIVLYCRSGRMSSIVAEELVNAGYTDIWNLEGGMIAWEKAGYELTGR